MNVIDKHITSFIKEHHVLTLATVSDNKPYCCNCFYVYLEESNYFVFTSDEETKHIKDIIKNNYTACAITLETSMIGKIRGLQITGKTNILLDMELSIAKEAYLKKFPIARMSKLNLWKFEPDFYKLTDNRLGFGKKIVWHAF